jgi:hypothetical protein
MIECPVQVEPTSESSSSVGEVYVVSPPYTRVLGYAKDGKSSAAHACQASVDWNLNGRSQRHLVDKSGLASAIVLRESG